MRAPKRAPFVFLLDGQLYVLSSRMSSFMSRLFYDDVEYDSQCFEMLDLKNLSQGWVCLRDPSFIRGIDVIASNHGKIVDYSRKMLYIRMLNWSLYDCSSNLHGYDVYDAKWHDFQVGTVSKEDKTRLSSSGSESLEEESEYDHDMLSPLTAFTGNLLKACWTNGCVIVEDYLYSFRIFRYPNEVLEAILIIRDLDRNIEVRENTVEREYDDDIHDLNCTTIEGRWEVNISHVVSPDVLHNNGAEGKLVYLGKTNSSPRFSLVVCYSCQTRDDYHVLCICTFDVMPNSKDATGESSTESFTVNRVCCKTRKYGVDGWNLEPICLQGVVWRLVIQELCHG